MEMQLHFSVLDLESNVKCQDIFGEEEQYVCYIQLKFQFKFKFLSRKIVEFEDILEAPHNFSLTN